MSATINVGPIPGPLTPPLQLVGLQSFNLIYNVPEPSAFPLVGVGAFLLCLASAGKRWLESPNG
jgi:hypothetical protein